MQALPNTKNKTCLAANEIANAQPRYILPYNRLNKTRLIFKKNHPNSLKL